MLNTQLRDLGLYAAHTIGDGNCLFRALSDQLYGSDAHHAQLRQDICSWIDAHRARYAPFVDDDRGIDVHLRCMRTPGQSPLVLFFCGPPRSVALRRVARRRVVLEMSVN